MNKNVLLALIISLLLLLVSCTPDHTVTNSEPVNSQLESSLQNSLPNDISSQSSPSDKTIADTKAKLISLKKLFPDCIHVCAYDSNKLLISRKDKLTVFNIETLQTVKDVTVSTEPVWADRLSDSFFYYSYDNHYVVLDKDFKQVNQFIVPEQKYSFQAISPTRKSLTYLSDDYRLMYMANADAAQDIGDGFYIFQYLDENHLITAYPYSMEYRIIDLETRDVTAYNATAIFPTTLSGGKLLTGEDSVSAELPFDNVVRVIAAVPPFDKYQEIKLNDLGESNYVTLSNSGKYILSLLTNSILRELPTNSVKFTSYNTETGEKQWSEVVTIQEASTVFVHSAIYFDSLNKIVFSPNKSDGIRSLSNPYILNLNKE